MYGDGRGICNILWGDSFKYSNQTTSTPDSERYCLVPTFPVGEENPNTAALRNIFPDETIGGAGQLISSISLLFVVLAITVTMVN